MSGLHWSALIASVGVLIVCAVAAFDCLSKRRFPQLRIDTARSSSAVFRLGLGALLVVAVSGTSVRARTGRSTESDGAAWQRWDAQLPYIRFRSDREFRPQQGEYDEWSAAQLRWSWRPLLALSAYAGLLIWRRRRPTNA